MREIVVILYNIRSSYNVGAILRTAEGFGVTRCYFSGYTPYPIVQGDSRLPHIAAKLHKSIAKTALGAEMLMPITHTSDIVSLLHYLKQSNYQIVGLEQDTESVELVSFKPKARVALLLGEEVDGIDTSLRKICEVLVEIPMRGKKESFNVSVAAGIALFQLSQA